MPSAPTRMGAGPPRGRPRLQPPEIDGTMLRCYTCGAAVTSRGPLSDRERWPALECPLPGCPGALVPEALN